MLHRLSTSFIRTLREDPADAEVASHRLLVRACYVRRAAPGVYTWLPLGLRTLRKIEDIVRQEMDAMGGQEVHFPALLPAEPYQATGRWDDYGPTLFKLRDRKDGDYLLAPTHEEMFTLAVKDLYSSYKDLPAVIYQIQTKYRDEARPRAGIIRGREFVMKDSYSFDIDDAGLAAAYQAHRDAYERIFTRLGLDYVIVNAMAGAMGGSHSEEFLHPCEIGEDTFVRSSGGYAANAEAVTTVVPEPVDASATGPAHVVDTPDTPTIDSLVDLCNEAYPRSDGRAWTAADTLKNVVVTLTHPGGERELLVVGVPGDRDVDMKRLEAAVAPAEVEMAGDTDFETHPELVRGYIGPTAIGPNSPLRRVEKLEDGTEVLTGSVRYLVDPRIVEGTSWVTGANTDKKHVLDLVMGRDFTADGTIEAAEVREGDPAPDGSGPLHLARGIGEQAGQLAQRAGRFGQLRLARLGFGARGGSCRSSSQTRRTVGMAWMSGTTRLPASPASVAGVGRSSGIVARDADPALSVVEARLTHTSSAWTSRASRWSGAKDVAAEVTDVLPQRRVAVIAAEQRVNSLWPVGVAAQDTRHATR